MTEGVKIIMHKEYWKEYNFLYFIDLVLDHLWNVESVRIEL